MRPTTGAIDGGGGEPYCFRIDRARAHVHVTHVMTRHGLREYPKSKRSHRVVPIPPDVLGGIDDLLSGRRAARAKDCTCPKVGEPPPKSVTPCPGLLFTAPEGGPIDDGNFRDRIWYPAVASARLCGKRPAVEDDDVEGSCGTELCDDPAHRIPRHSPDVMRHTAASWLVMDGVPLYNVQALLRHESYAPPQRYAHLAPDAHDKVLQSWARRSTQQRQRPKERDLDDADAPVTHDQEKPHPSSEEQGL